MLFLQAYEVDGNGDGRKDYLNLTLNFPLLDTENVFSVKVILIFDWTVYVCIKFE